MNKRTPEEIAAAQAAVNAKPAGAVLMPAPGYAICSRHHQSIPAGELAWRYPSGHAGGPGDPAYFGPNAGMATEYNWTCRTCGQGKGWEDPRP